MRCFLRKLGLRLKTQTVLMADFERLYVVLFATVVIGIECAVAHPQLSFDCQMNLVISGG